MFFTKKIKTNLLKLELYGQETGFIKHDSYVGVTLQHRLNWKSHCDKVSQALIGANIPWNKLSNPNFHDFLEKYCKWNIPHESTLSKTMLL